MSNVKLKDFITAENELDGSEYAYISQSDKTRKTTLQKIKDFILGIGILNTTDKTPIGAINELDTKNTNNSNKIGDLATLKTDAKDNLTNALNEIKSVTDSNATSLSENTQQLAQLSNPNILINGDFKNPVNQRGASLYTASGWGATYTIDRWLLYNNGLVLTVGTGGVSVNGDSFVIQRLEKKDYKKLIGKTITLSVKYVGNVADVNNLPVTVVMYDRISSSSAIVNTIKNKETVNIDANNHIYSLTYENFQANDVDYLEFLISTKSGYTLEYAKLEIGDKATPLASRSLGEEVKLCERYGEWIYTPFTAVKSLDYVQKGSFRTLKRNTPTLKFKSPNNIVGKLGYYDNATWVDIDISNTDWTNTLGYSLQLNGGSNTSNLFVAGNIYADSEIY